MSEGDPGVKKPTRAWGWQQGQVPAQQGGQLEEDYGW